MCEYMFLQFTSRFLHAFMFWCVLLAPLFSRNVCVCFSYRFLLFGMRFVFPFVLSALLLYVFSYGFRVFWMCSCFYLFHKKWINSGGFRGVLVPRARVETKEILEIYEIYDAGQYSLVSGSQNIGLHRRFLKFLRFLDTPQVPTAIGREILEF